MEPRELSSATIMMRRRHRLAKASSAQQEAELLQVGTFCDADCEDGHHNREGTYCQRCGSWIHKRVLEIDHPEYGTVVVGSECAKDLLGWKWGASHENALAVYQAFDDHLGQMGCVIGRYQRVKPKIYRMMAPIHGLSTWGAKSGIELRADIRVDLDSAISGPTARAIKDLNLPIVLPGEVDDDLGIQHVKGDDIIVTKSGFRADVQLEAYHWVTGPFLVPSWFNSALRHATALVTPFVYDPPWKIVGGNAPTIDQALAMMRPAMAELVKHSDLRKIGYVFRWEVNPRYGIMAKAVSIVVSNPSYSTPRLEEVWRA